ncbi:MAG: M23 family metallopeptidase [Candidatus Schekmanbacteria bacterium]|nr:M23 family metallopeptidase [Candidatus Schekmanbacteria bacterium]
MMWVSVLAGSLGAAGAHATSLDPDGGGRHAIRRTAPCLSAAARLRVAARLRANVEALRRRGLLPPGRATEPAVARAVAMSWPVVGATGLTAPGVHGIGAFVDHDATYPDHLRDYSCGGRSYDVSSGYNHQGTDIFSWPFSWYRMDRDEIIVLAAAPGTIVGKDDGNYDRSCGFGSTPWNAVYVQHGDGSTAWYGHLKSGSLTTKDVGETVAAGEYLGVVGSSGSSTGPHLHLELYDSADRLVDPYSGPCNDTIGTSWWANQREYYDSAINLIAIHSAPPEFPECPEPEVPNLQDVFAPGDDAYFAAYYRDQRANESSTYTVVNAAGTEVWRWDHSSPAEYYEASYWYWMRRLPTDGVHGKWWYRVTYLGREYEHEFWVGDAPTPTPTGDVTPTPTAGGSVPSSGQGSGLTLVALMGLALAGLIRRHRGRRCVPARAAVHYRAAEM